MDLTQYIVLLRGINVGGKNRIAMEELRTCLRDAGFNQVRSYIASGNVLLKSSLPLTAVESAIDSALLKRFGYAGPSVVLTDAQLTTVVQQAPPQFGSQPATYHYDVVFFKPPYTPAAVVGDIARKDGVDTADAGSIALYFRRLSAKRSSSRMGRIVEHASYKSLTIRNWNTVTKLLALAKDER